jgi:hypothetical protein
MAVSAWFSWLKRRVRIPAGRPLGLCAACYVTLDSAKTTRSSSPPSDAVVASPLCDRCERAVRSLYALFNYCSPAELSRLVRRLFVRSPIPDMPVTSPPKGDVRWKCPDCGYANDSLVTCLECGGRTPRPQYYTVPTSKERSSKTSSGPASIVRGRRPTFRLRGPES